MTDLVQTEESFAKPGRRAPGDFAFIRMKVEGAVARLTLQRPEHNLLNEQMLRELADGVGMMRFILRASPWWKRRNRCWSLSMARRLAVARSLWHMEIWWWPRRARGLPCRKLPLECFLLWLRLCFRILSGRSEPLNSC